MSLLEVASVDGPPPTKISPLNKKRRFVPNSISVTSSLGSSSDTASASFNSPVLLPAFGRQPTQSDVQTQLFQVGMRIRKSVKDGYQRAPKASAMFNCMDALGATSPPAGPAKLWTAYATPERQWKYTSKKKRTYNNGDDESCDEDSDVVDQSPVTPRFPGSDHRVAIPSEFFSINYDFDSMVDDDNQLTASEVPPSQKGVLKARVNGRSRKIALPRSRMHRSKLAFTNRNLMEDFVDTSQHKQPQYLSQQDQSMQTICEDNDNDNDNTTMTTVAAASCSGSLVAPGNTDSKDFGEADFLQRKEDIDMDFS